VADPLFFYGILKAEQVRYGEWRQTMGEVWGKGGRGGKEESGFDFVTPCVWILYVS
jgi:hypothetical protein